MTFSSMTTNAALKIVVDTNLFLSVFVFRGMMMQEVFDLVLAKKICMHFSPALKTELQRKMQHFQVGKSEQDGVLSFIEMSGAVIKPQIHTNASRDPKDNFLLELAQTANADYLITRDKDLLDLHIWKGTIIMKPEDFLPLLRKIKLL